MATISHAAHEVRFKMAYYGPPFAGKSTNLDYLRTHLDASVCSEMKIEENTKDRVLWFDFTPHNASVREGYRTCIEVWTAPGSLVFNAPRQTVLRDVDGVVFVADSQWDRMDDNVRSFRNLEENLERQNVDVSGLPCVLQFNKRDLNDIAPLHYLEFLLNNQKRRMPSFEAIASGGENVFATFNAICQIVLETFVDQLAAAAAAPA
jgi:mutual gliding-motility protein MglA